MKNHLLRILFLAITLTFPFSLYAQQSPSGSTRGKVSGRLIEASAKSPIGYANIVLLTAKDSSIVTGTTTDIEGVFILERVPKGQFILRASMVGYPTKYVAGINVTALLPEINLGDISMKAASTKLGEVEVVAEKQLVDFELDKRVVNVSQDINAQSGSVADVMQNLPSVTVDIDGNVSMRGSSNVTILINGKRSALSNLTLDQIPANLIESVELITNPSSKYNPEGTSGIINLVLKKETKPGLNGAASVTAATYDNYNASLNLNYRYNKWSLNTGYDFRQRNRPGNRNSTTTNFFYDESGQLDSTSFRLQNGDRSSTDVSHSFRFGADYYLTPKRTLSASAVYRFGQDEDTNDILYRFLNENRILTNTSRRLTNETEDEKAMDITLGYRQTFDKKGQELTADFVYNINVDDELSNFRETGDFTPEVQQTLVDDGNREIIAKADYVYPISEDSRFEAGFRSSFERLDEDSRFFDLNNQTGQLEFNTNQSNHFIFDQYIYSLYSNYSNKYKSISYQVGLRAEQTVTKADQRTQSVQNKNNYFSLFPTVFVTKDFNTENKLQFSYSRRINRPRSRFLNPFVDRTDRFNIRFGNPDLKPEYVNALELGYLRYWGTASLNATLFYRHTLDEIERFRRPTVVIVDGATVPGNEVTFLNVSDNRSYGAELGMNYPITKWWRLNGSISGFRTQLSTVQNDTELKSSRLSWTAKLNSTTTVWKDLDIQISGFYRAPMADIQGRMEQMFSTDLAMKKDILKKNATVSLRVSDVFNTRQFNFLSFGPGFRTESENRRQSRIIYLGFAYRINSDENNRRRDRNTQDGGMDEDTY